MAFPQVAGRFAGTGKRKNAIARVLLRPGSGDVKVNGRTLEDYFPRETSRMIVRQAFDAVEAPGKYDAECNVHGGGTAAQAEAVRHGLSRALVLMNPELRSPLRRAGFLTRDARKKERKKPGQPGARKRFQYSKR